MDPLTMHQRPQINASVEGQCTFEGNTNYMFGALGPYANPADFIANLFQHNNVVGYKSICDNGEEGRWIIIQSTNTMYRAYGPFVYDVDHIVVNEDSWITGVTLPNNQLVDTKGLGVSCFDCHTPGQFWLIHKQTNSIEDQGLDMLEVFLSLVSSNFDLPIVEQDIHQASSSLVQEVVIGEALPMPKRIRISAPSVATSANEVVVPWIEAIDNNCNEGIVPPMSSNSFETLEGNVALNQGAISSQEPQQVHESFGEINVEDSFQDKETDGQVVGGMVATTNANPTRGKPSKKQPRKPKFKHHSVKRREGGRTSFLANFRPKDLPESDKTFLTIGEFSNETDAWYAFNLFALVHEGEESCINMVNKDSIEMDAALWGDFPRVDLVAHLRLMGRGYFRSNILPQDSLIPRYRNVKFRKNTRGIDKEKIRWFCDVLLGEGVTDPNIDNGTKATSTYETAEEAAKEADRLMVLKEGNMAWTNYTLLDYMVEVEKDQWNQAWIPLQDNPKKYLSTEKYSFSN